MSGGCVTIPAPGEGNTMGEAIYAFTVPAGQRFYYHFAVITSAGNMVAPDSDPTAFVYLKRKADGDSSTNGPVLDCNENAETAFGISHNAVRAEINSYLDAGDYYLIVDNYGSGAPAPTTTSSRSDSSTTRIAFPSNQVAAPSYNQMITKLNAMSAKVIGVDTSGVSCGEAATANMAAYETRDFLDKIAIDTGSVDGTNGNPFTVSLKRDATDCAGSGSLNAIEGDIANTINNYTKTLRQDISVRAVDAVPLPSAAMQPPLPGGPRRSCNRSRRSSTPARIRAAGHPRRR